MSIEEQQEAVQEFRLAQQIAEHVARILTSAVQPYPEFGTGGGRGGLRKGCGMGARGYRCWMVADRQMYQAPEEPELLHITQETMGRHRLCLERRD